MPTQSFLFIGNWTILDKPQIAWYLVFIQQEQFLITSLISVQTKPANFRQRISAVDEAVIWYNSNIQRDKWPYQHLLFHGWTQKRELSLPEEIQYYEKFSQMCVIIFLKEKINTSKLQNSNVARVSLSISLLIIFMSELSSRFSGHTNDEKPYQMGGICTWYTTKRQA